MFINNPPASSEPYTDYDPKTYYPPLKECLQNNFGEYYFSEAVSTSFQRLYDNHLGIADKFTLFWSSVAKEFAGKKHVFGYELINEPVSCGANQKSINLNAPSPPRVYQ